MKAASSNIDDPAGYREEKFGKSAAAENTAKAQNKENVSETNLPKQDSSTGNKPAQKPQANGRINRLRVQN